MTMRDDDLMHDLRRIVDAIDATSVPDAGGAQAAFTWRTVDAELAAVTYDSLATAGDRPVMRASSTGPRRVEFSTDEVSIEVEIDDGRLVGQIVPAVPATIEVADWSTPQGRTRRTDVDDVGVFRLDDVRAGPTAMTVSAHDGSWSVRTEWIVV